MKEIPFIELWEPEMPCALCGNPADLGYSVPMYEGIIVDEELTDNWAGFPVCETCYENIYIYIGGEMMAETRIIAHCYKHNKIEPVTLLEISRRSLTMTFDCGYKTKIFFEE